MMHGFQQIIAQAERCYNFVVHGLPPLGDEMGVSPLIWRKKLMDSISGNLGYYMKRMDTLVRRPCVGGTQPLPPRGRHRTRQHSPLAGLGAATPQQVSGRYYAVGRAPGYATLTSL